MYNIYRYTYTRYYPIQTYLYMLLNMCNVYIIYAITYVQYINFNTCNIYTLCEYNNKDEDDIVSNKNYPYFFITLSNTMSVVEMIVFFPYFAKNKA